MKQDKEFAAILSDLLENPLVIEMKKYRQHYNVSTFEHSVSVAYISYKICKKLNLDYVSMARAGLLHDLFLYDWREERPVPSFFKKHAFSHPDIALKNAEKICDLNNKEKNIIRNHMWPVTFYRLPHSREAFIITVVDKYVTISESINYYKESIHNSFKKHMFNKSTIS